MDQYTDLDESQKGIIEAVLPKEKFQEFKSSYLETAKQLRKIKQTEGDEASPELQELDFEFVLFASSVIDYDYIMSLVADNMGKTPGKQKMTKAQIIALLKSEANLMNDEEAFSEFLNGLDWSEGKNVEKLNKEFEIFVIEKNEKELAAIAQKHGLQTAELKSFVENIMSRMIFDGEKLTDLLEPLQLSWKERRIKELALMADLVPQLLKLAQDNVISGLAAYE